MLQNPFERDQVLVVTAAGGGFELPIGDVKGNELFPRCDTRLVGFVSRGATLHAVTTQLIAQGRPAEDRYGELRDWFTSQGFVFISAWTWFRPSDGVALFDAMSKNVMRCDDGETVPFDVIPIRCEGMFLEMMHAAIERMA